MPPPPGSEVSIFKAWDSQKHILLDPQDSFRKHNFHNYTTGQIFHITETLLAAVTGLVFAFVSLTTLEVISTSDVPLAGTKL